MSGRQRPAALRWARSYYSYLGHSPKPWTCSLRTCTPFPCKRKTPVSHVRHPGQRIHWQRWLQKVCRLLSHWKKDWMSVQSKRSVYPWLDASPEQLIKDCKWRIRTKSFSKSIQSTACFPGVELLWGGDMQWEAMMQLPYDVVISTETQNEAGSKLPQTYSTYTVIQCDTCAILCYVFALIFTELANAALVGRFN